MKEIIVHHYNAFSTVPDKGNPAAVVLDAEALTESQMQEIARKVGFNETVFVLSSKVADIKLRYFTPGHEVNLCGHATMASIYALKTRGLLNNQSHIQIETKAGVLPIEIRKDEHNQVVVSLQQASPQFTPFKGSLQNLMQAIGLEEQDLHPEFPVLYGSTGTWTLLLPIKELQSFSKMKPDNKRFPEILIEMPHASVHPFCFQTFDGSADMHGRHFSSPYSGTTEDPVTGTASGVMGVYYLEYVNQTQDQLELKVEQGHEINREGFVHVNVQKENKNIKVEMSGTSVYIQDITITLDSIETLSHE
ncbi:PhzF family phenazine biosynthesis protein [Priestia endophytica]|uniref:PhzF family phenazine biosynthesis protein n=1 Tax=Priestia endophytica TaxID=135735 RepID=UPI000DCA5999|nr:PhzF family phenazine biosynthesis protein [Priestia endophytica]RAS71701.1 isomerase [Priestia endophytica]